MLCVYTCTHECSEVSECVCMFCVLRALCGAECFAVTASSARVRKRARVCVWWRCSGIGRFWFSIDT